MAIFGSLATVRAQAYPLEAFAAAFAYLDEVFRPDSAAATRLRATGIGETQRIELGGGVFALEQVHLTKERNLGFFESHRNYTDVQVVVEGEEWMEVVDFTQAVVKQRYDSSRDLIVYQDALGSSLKVPAGHAAIFHPLDVHMPSLCGSSPPMLVRKTVIKVPTRGL